MATATIKEIQLHNSIKEKDDIALSKLYDMYGDYLVKTIKARYPKSYQDESFAFEAVNEALFGYFNSPDTFDPQLNTLKRFLEIAAERDILNLLQKEKKHSKKINLPDDVELHENFWNSIVKEENLPDSDLISSQSLKKVEQELEKHFNKEDLLLAKMVLIGERSTEVFSKVLKIEGLTIEEQKNEVKKVKDRIKKVIERNQIETKLKNILK